MARISKYPLDSSISREDLLVGTDAEDGNITKNFSIGALIDFIPALVPGGGTVTSVAATGLDGIFVDNSPITTEGTLTIGINDGGIPITKLASSAITINGTSVSLGGSIAVDGAVTSLATNGTSGEATLISGVLNIPNYGASTETYIQVSRNFIHKEQTLSDALLSVDILQGDSINVAERTTGNGGGGMWDVVLSSSVTENSYNIVQCTGIPTLSLVLRINGYVNIKQLGTTGTADDTLLFQAAIDALSDGDTLDLNSTNSVIKNTFITTNNVTIKNGKITGHVDLLGVMIYVTGNNVAFKDLRSYIDGASSVVSKGTITFFECINGTVTNCRLEGGRRSGVNNNVANMVCAAKSSGIIITNNVFYEAHYVEMVQFESSTSCVVSNNVMSSTGLAYSAIATSDFYTVGGDSKHIISNNTCTNYLTSILTINTAGVSITGNVLDISVEEQGINMGHIGSGAPDCTVTGNTISNCAGAGVALAEATNTVVSSNVIRDCGEAGIDTASTISAIISDNFIHNIGNLVTGNGIKLSTSVSSSYSITGNRFKTIKGNGIEINGSVVDCIVTNNIFSDINTGAFSGGRFPVKGTLDASILPKTIIFDNNVVNGTFTSDKVISLGNTHSDMILSISNNTLPAITTTAQLFLSTSGTQPLSKSISKNKMGAAPMVGVATITGGTNSVVVSNINQTPFQRPIIIEVDNDAAEVEIYVSSFGTGTFTISSRLTPSFDALIQYDIG